MPDQRRDSAASNDAELVRRRALGSLYIVDEFLNVLFYRQDPAERRRDCVMQPGSKTLPPLIERTVIGLLRRSLAGEPDGDTLSAAPNASLVIRVVRLNGTGGSGFAIIAERLKVRRHVDVLVQRYNLSARERQVLHLISRGAKNSEIAKNLQIAESTAIFHVKRILSKTNSRNRTELVSKVIG